MLLRFSRRPGVCHAVTVFYCIRLCGGFQGRVKLLFSECNMLIAGNTGVAWTASAAGYGARAEGRPCSGASVQHTTLFASGQLVNGVENRVQPSSGERTFCQGFCT